MRSESASRVLSLAAVFATRALVGCGGDESGGDPGGSDAGSDAARDGSVPGADGGALADGSASRDGVAPPPCGDGAWATYGHDARRTFASDACIKGPLTVAWQYKPAPPSGRTYEASFHAIAQKDAVFLAWMASAPPYTGTTAADRIDTAGKRVWTFDTGTDTNEGNWPSLWNDSIVLNDDGLYFLHAADGARAHDDGVDWWGQTAPDPARLYVVNQMQADGPGIFVGATDAVGKLLWQANKHEMCGQGWGDVMGGLAVANDVVYYAPKYQSGGGTALAFNSGVFAFAGADGAPKWSKDAKPASAISVGDGKVYLVEEPATLVARATTDGAVAWSKPLAPDAQGVVVGSQAPVLANGLVIVATSAGIVAVRGDTGKDAWKSPAVAYASSFAGAIGNGCGGNIAAGGARQTTMAAALATSTLVVTAQDGLHILSLADGSDTYKLVLDGGFAGLRDPVLVGKTVYVVASEGVIALAAP